MQFNPSRQSYGFYGEEEPVHDPEGEGEGSTLAKVEAFLPAVRSFLFGESAREEVAVLREQIQNLERKLDAGAGVLHNYYVNDLNKKRARLQELELIAGEEKSSAEKAQITRGAIAIGAVLGTLVIVGMIFNQVQKARLLQAQIHQAEG